MKKTILLYILLINMSLVFSQYPAINNSRPGTSYFDVDLYVSKSEVKRAESRIKSFLDRQ